MLQLVAWGLEEYSSPEAIGALAGLAQQSKAVLLRTWLGFESDDGYSGTGRRVYENYDADTAEGYSYSSSAFPMYFPRPMLAYTIRNRICPLFVSVYPCHSGLIFDAFDSVNRLGQVCLGRTGWLRWPAHRRFLLSAK